MVFWGLINVAISAGFALAIKAPILRAYLALNYVLIVNPVFMWANFELSHPLFDQTSESYTDALIFTAAFNLVLCTTFLVLMRAVPRSRVIQTQTLQHPLNNTHNVQLFLLAALALAAVGFWAKLGLDSIGYLRSGDGSRGNPGPWLQLMKVVSGFDLMAIILLGEFRQVRKRSGVSFVIIALLAAAFYFAMQSGSRAQAVTVLIVGFIAFRDVVTRFWVICVPAALASIPTIFSLFPLLSNYRNSGYDFAEARHLLALSGTRAQDTIADVVVTRFNYHEVLARVIDYVSLHHPAGGTVYWNNIVGVIPRLIWPGKPQIANDSQLLGHQLGLVTVDDHATSVGLQVIGEAYFEFGWIGLVVAAFQALLFVLIQKNLYVPRNAAAMTAYVFVTLYILQRDGYFAIVPGLMWVAIGLWVFFLGLRWALGVPRGIRYENLPHRLPH